MVFRQKTIDTVIIPFLQKLSKMDGYVYPTQGQFYREIEILKFPRTAKYESKRNMYGTEQYQTIYHFLRNKEVISVAFSKETYNAYQVTVNATAAQSQLIELIRSNEDTSRPEKVEIETKGNFPSYSGSVVSLQRIDHPNGNHSNIYELVLPAGEGLSARDLKLFNQRGFVYHSESTDVDFETDNGIDYMDIFYFAKVDSVAELFAEMED